MRNNSKACLTDKLNFEVLKEKGDDWVKTEFTGFRLSPDETKILFGALAAMGDLAHGSYCLANADASKQQILEGADIAGSKKPVWLKNNTVAFTGKENNLFVTNNDDKSVQKMRIMYSYVAK